MEVAPTLQILKKLFFLNQQGHGVVIAGNGEAGMLTVLNWHFPMRN